jgi:hypothetical protein
MSTIDKKPVIEGRNEDSNSLDLFKDVSTGNLVYRTALGIEVVVATQVGLQDVLNRLVSAETLLEIIKTVPAIAKVIKEAEAKAEKEAAVRDLGAMQAAAAEKNLKAEAPAEEL